jgi:hypothetical protein
MKETKKAAIQRALEFHDQAGRIAGWEHASAGNYIITGHGASSRVFTPREAELFCLGLASAAQQPTKQENENA